MEADASSAQPQETREADLDSVRGKAVDVKEETGSCTPRDRRDRGPGIQGRIGRDNVGKVPPAAGAGRNLQSLLERGLGRRRGERVGSTNESVRAGTGE